MLHIQESARGSYPVLGFVEKKKKQVLGWQELVAWCEYMCWPMFGGFGFLRRLPYQTLMAHSPPTRRWCSLESGHTASNCLVAVVTPDMKGPSSTLRPSTQNSLFWDPTSEGPTQEAGLKKLFTE